MRSKCSKICLKRWNYGNLLWVYGVRFKWFCHLNILQYILYIQYYSIYYTYHQWRTRFGARRCHFGGCKSLRRNGNLPIPSQCRLMREWSYYSNICTIQYDIYSICKIQYANYNMQIKYMKEYLGVGVALIYNNHNHLKIFFLNVIIQVVLNKIV